MPSIAEYAAFLQRELFPRLEQEEVGPLSRLDEQFCQVMSLTELGRFTAPFGWCGTGRPPKERVWLIHAFIAKAVYQFATTAALIEALKARPTLRRLCGYEKVGDIPSEPTFSRAFADFAGAELPQRIHEHLIKIHVGPRLVGHLSRDSTAIEVPEKPVLKEKPPEPARPKKRGRPRRGEERPAPQPKRLDLQGTRSLEENLADLPTPCAIGAKLNSKGHLESWIGYKLHIDTNDWGVPISVILTSASVHDSQVAIALAQMSAERVTALYAVMDSAYDAPQIHAFTRGLGQVPIIDPNPRRGEKIPLPPAEKERFKERSTIERVNSLLKQRYGARWVRVRGAQKVFCHLMFGVVALTATLLFARLV
jgi:hypothetical protein